MFGSCYIYFGKIIKIWKMLIFKRSTTRSLKHHTSLHLEQKLHWTAAFQSILSVEIPTHCFRMLEKACRDNLELRSCCREFLSGYAWSEGRGPCERCIHNLACIKNVAATIKTYRNYVEVSS